jgi:glycerophosphoryl diester phosphodiesterase
LRGRSEQHAARLRELGIDAVNLHESEWTGGLVTLYHRFGIRTFGWDAQHHRALVELLRAGIDGVYSDHVDLMMAAIDEVHNGG